MKTQYTDAEIEALVQDVKNSFLEPAFQALIKAQSEKTVLDSKEWKEAGVGTVPANDDAKRQNDVEPRPETLTATSQPSKSGTGAASGKIPDVTMKAEDDGASKDPSPSPSPASEPSAAAASEPSAAPDAAPSAPADAAPQGDAAPQDPAMAQGGEGGVDLVSAYDQLDDETLKSHYDALRQVVMQRMGGQDPNAAAAPGADPSAMGAAPAPAAPAPSPSPAPAPAAAAPSPSPAPEMAMKSELVKKEEELKQMELKTSELVSAFTSILNAPRPRAITSAMELTKSEGNLSKDLVEKKLLEKAKDPSLKKSDRDLLYKYFTPRTTVELSEVEHLLK